MRALFSFPRSYPRSRALRGNALRGPLCVPSASTQSVAAACDHAERRHEELPGNAGRRLLRLDCHRLLRSSPRRRAARAPVTWASTSGSTSKCRWTWSSPTRPARRSSWATTSAASRWCWCWPTIAARCSARWCSTAWRRRCMTCRLCPASDFQIVTVSFDPRETPQLAAAKKKSYVARYGRPGAAEGWHFLTGKQPIYRAALPRRRLSLSSTMRPRTSTSTPAASSCSPRRARSRDISSASSTRPAICG